jgi:uncharacterized protein (TIGR03437 family)
MKVLRSGVHMISAAAAFGLLSLAASGDQQWFSAWSVAHDQRIATSMSGTSVRMIVRPTISGSAVRVRVENRLGQSAVVFSSAYIGKVLSGASLAPGSNTQLTFSGSAGLTLAAGAGAYSDPVTIQVTAFTRYAISLDVATASDISAHSLGLVTNYMATGTHAADPTANGYTTVPDTGPSFFNGPVFPFYWVAALDVAPSSSTGTVVALGDSITDGYCSTRTNNGGLAGMVLPDLYNRWTDLLATRFSGLSADQWKAVADEGIAGNNVVTGGIGPTALARLQNDVLGREGVTHVIFFEGTNDIGNQGLSATTVIAGDQQLIDRVHAAGVKIVGATIIPRGAEGAWTSNMEQQRLAVNNWIRHSADFDGLIDFDAVMQGTVNSKNNAVALPSQWSCFDGVHPNAAGYAAMSAAIDLSLFRSQTAATVNAASFDSATISPGAIVSLYGVGLADTTEATLSVNLPTSLAGVSVTVQDSMGTMQTAQLFFVSPGQINFLVPAGLATGSATVTVVKGSSPVATSAIQITAVAPGLFTANSNGSGVASAYFSNAANTITAAFTCGNTAGSCVSAPFDLSTAPGGAVLILYGTGIRNNTGLGSTMVTIGGIPSMPVYAGPQNQYPGLDQMNVQVPAGLAGKGEVNVVVMVEGRAANSVRVAFK